MSGWSGLASAALALVLAFFAASQPLWEYRLTEPTQTTTWSYRLFGVTERVDDGTANTTRTTTYTYYELPTQVRMSTLFIELGRWFILSAVLTLAGAALAVLAQLGRLRGLFAGLALVGACALVLYSAIDLVLAIPAAAGDLPTYGQNLPDFRGQITIPQVSGPAVVLSWGPGMAWILLLVIGLVQAWGGSDVWGVRARARPKERPVAVEKAEEAAPAPEPTPAAEVLVTPEPEPTADPELEEVFLIAPSGLLVKHLSRSLMTDKDRDVVGGMIAVVSNFVREAFTERDGSVEEVSLGDHRFLIVSQEGAVLAVLVKSGDKEDIVHRLRHTLVLLLDRYGDRLLRWNGFPLEGIEDELSVLWEPFFVPPPPAE